MKSMLDDLARSGIARALAVNKMKCRINTPEETAKLTKDKFQVPSYVIPYLSPSGVSTGFYRLRMLEAPTDPDSSPTKRRKGFARSASKQSKPIRYWQPPNTLPRIYFPPNCKWSSVLTDTSKRLYVTEGEKKAVAACKHGLPCIGLGGVWSWRSEKGGKSLIDDFQLIDWSGREVCLVFDSDLSSNADVAMALSALTNALNKLGATVSVVYLPEADDGTKQGLDDFLLASGKDAFLALPEEMSQVSVELQQMNEECAFIQSLNSVFHFPTNSIIRKASDLSSMLYANRFMLLEDGNGKQKRVNVAQEWLRWPFRREHSHIVYAPGEDPVTRDGGINSWRGWGRTPMEGSAAPWEDLLDYLFAGDADIIHWFQQWCAYPLQHPGTKLYSAVMMFGLEHGTGKSFVGYLLGSIYGDNFNVIGDEDLHKNYNGWAVNKQFILGEELTGTERRSDADKLRHMVTREVLQVDVKYQPQYSLKDCINYYLTSNRPDALFLDIGDRRAFVWEVLKPKRPFAFYDKIDKWKNGNGPAILFDHLLRYDLAGFQPHAPAPMTAAKEDMIDLSVSDLDLWARQLKNDPDQFLRMGGQKIDRDLFTIQELVELVPGGDKRNIASIALSKALRRAGFRQLSVTKTASGAKRLWPVRNLDKWARADHYERVQDYDRSVIHIEKARSKMRGVVK